MKAVYGLYSTPEEAQKAVDGLRATGLSDTRITIISSEPLEEYEFGQRDRGTLMSWLAGAGAVIGMITGYLLTSVTQQLWPINTGGMPIVSGWTNLIVIFELTMLGAVLTTVGTLLVTAKLPGKPSTMYDPEISNGQILIGVADPPDSTVAVLERTLRATGSGKIRTIS